MVTKTEKIERVCNECTCRTECEFQRMTRNDFQLRALGCLNFREHINKIVEQEGRDGIDYNPICSKKEEKNGSIFYLLC